MKAIKTLEVDNLKLKDTLDLKSMELEQLNGKLYKQKTYSEDTVVILKRENDTLRSKLLELERINEEEFIILKEKLSQVHEAEI